MPTAVAVTFVVVFFVAFALLGPAERSRPCGGKGPEESPCAGCPLAGDGGAIPTGPWKGCPGSKRVQEGK